MSFGEILHLFQHLRIRYYKTFRWKLLGHHEILSQNRYHWRNTKLFTVEAAEKTGGKGIPASNGTCGSFPGPVCSRSLRLEPSALLLDVTGPNKRLLNSFGVSGETFVLELKESNPKGEWDSLLSTDLSDPDSARQIATLGGEKKKKTRQSSNNHKVLWHYLLWH